MRDKCDFSRNFVFRFFNLSPNNTDYAVNSTEYLFFMGDYSFVSDKEL